MPAVSPHAAPRRATPASAVLLANVAFIVVLLIVALVLAYGGMFVADGSAPLTDPRRILHIATHKPHPTFSYATLSVGLVIMLASLATRGGRQIRRLRLGRMLRIVFAPGYLRHRSHRLDVLFVIANVSTFVLLFGWLILSSAVFSNATTALLDATIGPLRRTTLSPSVVAWAGAIALYLAFEFAYWLDHTLSHRIPALWEFHRVHHEAEVLSPLTTFRVHPIDTVVYYNILSAVTGITHAIVHWGFGVSAAESGIIMTGLFLAVFSYLCLQIQHTQVWIPFTGWLGRVLISPAHHQIHHSSNPLHHDKNMGNCLAVFDWLFGTLHVPARAREKLTFGVVPTAAERHDPHSVEGAFLAPFARSATQIAGAMKRDTLAATELPRMPQSSA